MAAAAERIDVELPAAESVRGWFARVDDFVANPTDRCLHVTGPIAELRALAEHVRSSVGQRRVLRTGDGAWDDPWLELAARLGISLEQAADELVASILDRAGNAILLVDNARTTAHAWSSACVAALFRHALAVEATVLLLGGSAPPGINAVEIDGPLSEEDLVRWWRARERAIARVEGVSLAGMAHWWEEAASRLGLGAPESVGTGPLSEDAARLWRRLSLLGRSCPPDKVSQLASPNAEGCVPVQSAMPGVELVQSRIACVDERGALGLRGQYGRVELDRLPALIQPEDVQVVGQVLDEIGDAFSLARAAELFGQIGAGDVAETYVQRSLRVAKDPAARRDIARRWIDLIQRAPSQSGSRMLRLAAALLRTGDTALALDVAQRGSAMLDASTSDGEHLPTSGVAGPLLVGRAALEMGDLATTAAAFSQAEARAAGPELGPVAAHVAELHTRQGRLDDAVEAAHRALSYPLDADTKLLARNALGKVLLARGQWDEAEQHFAHDEMLAHGAGEVDASLRARLNRYIAVLSAGRLREARAGLERLTSEAEQVGSPVATALVQANLATVLTLTHDYEQALSQWETAIDKLRGHGDRARLARLIINLAELRIRLGLHSEAEQALAFGGRACAGELGAPIASLTAFVRAKLRLSQGRTAEAHEAIVEALDHAKATSNGAKPSQCHRLAAHIALEEGDLARAEAAVAEAHEQRPAPQDAADAACLATQIARGRGEPFDDLALAALSAAQQSDNPDLVCHAHVLVAESAKHNGEFARAARHVLAAAGVVDRLIGRLPATLQARYRQRRELAGLWALQAELQDHAPAAPRSRAEPTPGSGLRAAHGLVGDSAEMHSLISAIRRVAPNLVPALVLGESGTGKELVADALHAMGGRPGPLVKVNCAAVPESLLLSDLFGHEKGAFTGAAARRVGRFEEADGGTLFLDEIGDISPAAQVALLRVLADGRFYRVGGNVSIKADVRIVCATHRDLPAMVKSGTFREDLYYRIAGVVLRTPALRDRPGDLPALCRTLLSRIASDRSLTLSDGALALLRRHRWPGNVRELENALRGAALFAEGGLITERDFVDNVPALHSTSGVSLPSETSEQPEASEAASVDLVYRLLDGTSLPELRRRLEHQCIERALAESGGNVTQAARKLGMKRPRLSQLIHQHGLKPAPDAPPATERSAS